MNTNANMTQHNQIITLQKGNTTCYCPICNKVALDINETTPCEHVMHINIGGEMVYLHPKLQQNFEECVELEEKTTQPSKNRDSKQNPQEQHAAESALDMFVQQFQHSDKYMSVRYVESSSVPFATLDINILYQCHP